MEKVLQIAPDDPLHPGGIKYNAMTFNGTIPAPVISTDQGDTVQMTLINQGKQIHSLDFHAAIGPSQVLSGNVNPGQSKTWTFKTPNAGFWLYHCGADGLNGVWQHIADGMYGGLVVHPINEKPAKEFYVSFGEIYNSADKGLFKGTNGTVGSFDIAKFASEQPDLILTNGMAFKYVPSIGVTAKIPLNNNATVFHVKPGELTRWYILAPGPNEGVSFHFIAGQLSAHDGSVINRAGTTLLNGQTYWIPVGSGSVIESVFPEQGNYVAVDHDMAHVLKGGAFIVNANNSSTENDHPAGTWVPPKGSPLAASVNPPGVTSTPSPVTASSGSSATTNATMTATPSNTTSSNATTAPAAGTNTTTSSNATTGNATASPAAAGGSTAAGGTSVSITSGASSKTDTAFSPNPINVKVGDTVTWTNNDSQPHTVVSGTGASDANKGKVFDSSPNFTPLINPGGTYSHKFTSAGDVPYFCQLHPNMVGKVSVS
jgi:nitrite reductase (NO-forming)